MIINNVGYNHRHDADFFIDRPMGSDDYLLLLIKTDAIFTFNGKEMIVPENSFMIYRKETPQLYRCVPQTIFSNDWIHFDFENEEEEAFLSYHIPYETPIHMESLHFLSYCIKSIAYEAYSHNKNRKQNIENYMSLIFSKVEEQMYHTEKLVSDNKFEMLSTVRNKIFSKPYEQRTAFSAAHEVGMSKSSFQHAYKNQFGTTFINDLIESRISYAKMLLVSTNLPIDDVRDQCGYRTYVHFARQFKQRTGITPSKYRDNFKATPQKLFKSKEM